MEVVGISVEVRKLVFFGKLPWHKWIYMYRDVDMLARFSLFSYDTAMYENELIKSKEDTISNKSKI